MTVWLNLIQINSLFKSNNLDNKNYRINYFNTYIKLKTIKISFYFLEI